MRHAVESLVLLAWCVFEPGSAPPTDYVVTFNANVLGLDKDKVIGQKEAAWNRALIASWVHQYG